MAKKTTKYNPSLATPLPLDKLVEETGHVTAADSHVPKSARSKQRTTLVTRKTGTKKPTPKGKK